MRAMGMFDSVRLNENSGCLEWTGHIDKYGYGKKSNFRGRPELAHRVAAILWLGFQPAPGLCVLHRCDNPACVNPKHLFIGTHTDNIRDCVAKGRHKSANSKKTHCPQGHELVPGNLVKANEKQGRRACLICHRESVSNRYRAKRLAQKVLQF